MSDDILDFVSVRPLDRAQRVTVLKRLSDHPDAASVPHLPPALATALAHEEELGALHRRRREAPRALHGPDAPALDQRVDDLIAVLHGRLTLSVRFDPPPATEGTHAALLLSALLPTVRARSRSVPTTRSTSRSDSFSHRSRSAQTYRMLSQRWVTTGSSRRWRRRTRRTGRRCTASGQRR